MFKFFFSFYNQDVLNKPSFLVLIYRFYISSLYVFYISCFDRGFVVNITFVPLSVLLYSLNYIIRKRHHFGKENNSTSIQLLIQLQALH